MSMPERSGASPSCAFEGGWSVVVRMRHSRRRGAFSRRGSAPMTIGEGAVGSATHLAGLGGGLLLGIFEGRHVVDLFDLGSHVVRSVRVRRARGVAARRIVRAGSAGDEARGARRLTLVVALSRRRACFRAAETGAPAPNGTFEIASRAARSDAFEVPSLAREHNPRARARVRRADSPTRRGRIGGGGSYSTRRACLPRVSRARRRPWRSITTRKCPRRRWPRPPRARLRARSRAPCGR